MSQSKNRAPGQFYTGQSVVVQNGDRPKLGEFVVYESNEALVAQAQELTQKRKVLSFKPRFSTKI